MSSRDTIFSKIRSALGDVKDKAAYPDYDVAVMHAKPKLEGTPREDAPARPSPSRAARGSSKTLARLPDGRARVPASALLARKNGCRLTAAEPREANIRETKCTTSPCSRFANGREPAMGPEANASTGSPAAADTAEPQAPAVNVLAATLVIRISSAPLPSPSSGRYCRI